MVVGVSAQGEAIAGGGKHANPNDFFESESKQNGDNNVIHNANWIDITLNIDPKLLAENFQKNNKSLRDEGAWAERLNKAVTSEIRKSGTRHLLTGHKGFAKFASAYFIISEVIMGSMGMDLADLVTPPITPHLPTIESITFEVFFHTIFWNIWSAFVSGNGLSKGEGHGHRLSLIPGFEAERAFFLQFAAQLLPVVISENN